LAQKLFSGKEHYYFDIHKIFTLTLHVLILFYPSI